MRQSLRISSVRVRLTLWNVGVLALVLLIFGGAIRYVLQASLSASADRKIAAQVARIRAQPLALGLPMGRILPPYRAAILDLQGRPLTPYSPGQAWDPRTFAAATADHELYSTIKRGPETLRILSAPLYRDGTKIGVIQAVTPITDDIRDVERITRVLLTLIPLALLAAGGGGAFLTGRALRPVRDISHAASRIEASNLSGRLAVVGDDELAELACTFNAMLGRLEDAFNKLTEANERQRRFTADASHELRTPLTIIKANTSLALMSPRTAAEYRQALEAVDHSADRTVKIVHDLLLLARVDAGQLHLQMVPLTICDILETSIRDFVPPGSAPVTLDVPQTMRCLGDGESLSRVFGNLLFNATQHTPQTGRIVVSAVEEGEDCRVEIADTGVGIAPEHLPHLGERFYRVDAARSGNGGGTGLGLAICKGIVEAHGGHMEITSKIGQGTTVAVTLHRALPDTVTHSNPLTLLDAPSSVLHDTLV